LSVEVTDANGCKAKGAPPRVKAMSPADIATYLSEDIAVYPNPTTGNFTISNVTNATVYVYTTLSHLVRTFENITHNETININHLPSGVYFIKIVDGDTIKNEKIILSK
jgi:hypothetical protein